MEAQDDKVTNCTDSKSQRRERKGIGEVQREAAMHSSRRCGCRKPWLFTHHPHHHCFLHSQGSCSKGNTQLLGAAFRDLGHPASAGVSTAACTHQCTHSTLERDKTSQVSNCRPQTPRLFSSTCCQMPWLAKPCMDLPILFFSFHCHTF